MQGEENFDVQEQYNYISNNELFDLSEGEISQITEEEEKEIDLNNFESLIVEKKPKVYQNEKPYNFTKDKERADVYIKNYLMKFDMINSLKILEQEFFELLSKGDIEMESIPNVPNVYIQSEIFQERIGNIQKELDDAKIYAEKANSLFLKLQKAKENEKIKHRRVQQEKQTLIKEIEKMKKVYSDDDKIYKELKKKYWDVTKESLVLEQDLKGLTSKVENLNDQYEKLKKTVDESKKQKECKIYLFKISIKRIRKKRG